MEGSRLAVALALLAVLTLAPFLALAAVVSNEVASGPGPNVGAATAAEGTERLGGPAVDLTRLSESMRFNPAAYAAKTMSIVDPDGDSIDSLLEEKLAQLAPDEPVVVVVTFAARTAAFGVPEQVLQATLSRAVGIAESLGGRLVAGPWMHALVGFAVEMPAGAVRALADALQGFDADSDGSPDRVLLAAEREYRIFNFWSSKQMNVRPYVWNNLGVNGTGVTVVVIDTGIDGNVEAFAGKIIYWADYTGDPNGNIRNTPYDDNMHGTHVAGTVAGVYNSMDAQGRFVLTFGIGDIDLSQATSGAWLRWTYPFTAYYVNTTGTIEVNFKYNSDPDGTIQAVGLAFCGNTPYYNCNPTQNIVAQVSTPNANTWYNLTYQVASSADFGWYAIVFQVGTPGGVAMLFTLRAPAVVDDPSGVPYLSGMAPAAALGGAKVLDYTGGGSTADITSAIDDVVANRTAYTPPLYIISMSLGGGYDATLDQAVSNAANAGVLAVVAAGNDGAASGTAATGSPASNPYAITVAATDAFNNITDYSSDGGASQSASTYTKPDVAAPGGGLYMLIFSADTTWHDDLNNVDCFLFWCSEDLDFQDQFNLGTEGFDDSIGIMGTSMATPHVSGVAALVVSALLQSGIQWDWNSFSTAGLAKAIILMSTWETYPLYREPDNVSYSPTLEKGGKDIHEGFGAVDAGAAVNIALSMGAGQALLPGSVVSGQFRQGTAYNADFDQGVWSWPFGPSVWGQRVYFPFVSFTLSNGTTYDVTYGVALYANTADPANTDFDLYLYDVAPTTYGEPSILKSSVQAMGVTSETLTVTPAVDGFQEAIVVAKRAREDSAGGAWSLSVGPFASARGQAPDGLYYDGQAWIGYPVEVYAFSALKASQVVVEFFDNTTGVSLGTVSAAMTDQGAYSDATVQWTMPNDPNLVGNTVVVITKYLDAQGNVVSGPYYTTLTVNDVAAPIPEPGFYAAVAALAAVAAYLLLLRRRGAPAA